MRFLVPCVMLVFFAGCCKMYCEDTELTLSFEKFKARDTDTVYFVSYQPKSGLTQVVDTFRILSVIPAADTSRSSVFHYISSQYDWKVIVPSLNREYVFEAFEHRNHECNCGGSDYKSVKSVTVNGIRREGSVMRLE